jgi:inner membrane protein
MPTILTHPAAPLAIAWGLGREVISTRLLAVGVITSVVPDLDVLAFRLGISYAAEFGHRGFSHSLLLALIVAAIGASSVRPLHTTSKRAFWFLLVAMASHGILDALTNGGLGIAFLWPFSGERFFAPFQPIEVAPLGLSRFLSPKGVAVLWSEILWVWLPLFGAAAIAVAFRRYRTLTLRSTGARL